MFRGRLKPEDTPLKQMNHTKDILKYSSLLFNFIITKNKMNILDYEEAAQVEEQLLNASLPTQYIIKTSTSQELQARFQGLHKGRQKIFDFSKEFLLKKIAVSEYYQHYTTNDPNSAFKMVIYCLFASTYPPTSSQNAPLFNPELIRSLKCTLYSKDVSLDQIKNFPLKIENHIAQVILASFFKEIAIFYEHSRNNRFALSYAMKLLQDNSFVEQILIASCRIILSKLQIQGAQNFSAGIDSSQAIINLIQFFDLNYRQLDDDIILFYEEKLFLLINKMDLVFGEYAEQDNIKEKAKKQTGTTQENRFFSLNETAEIDTTRKKRKVGQQDKDLLSSLLQSSRSEKQGKLNLQTDQETPHFTQELELAFGRKRKDQNQIQKNQAMKKEFAMLISSEQYNEVGIEQIKEQSSPVSSVGVQADIEIQNKSDKEQRRMISKRATMQVKRDISRILEEPQGIDSQSGSMSNYHFKSFSNGSIGQPQISTIKQSVNIVAIKDKVMPSTPQNIYSQQNYRLSFDQDLFFPESPPSRDIHQNIQRKQNSDWCNPENRKKCPCYPYRYKQNHVVSHVVNLNFVSRKTSQPLLTKNINTVSHPNIVIHSPHKCRESKEQKIPTFLKARIEKNINGQSPQNPIKCPNNQKRSSQKSQTKTWQQPSQKIKTLSQIISNQAKQMKQRQRCSRKMSSISKNKSIASNKNIASGIKKYDMEQANRRPNLGQPWKKTSQITSNNQNAHKINENNSYRQTLDEHRRSYIQSNSYTRQATTNFSPDSYVRSSNASKNPLSLDKNYTTPPAKEGYKQSSPLVEGKVMDSNLRPHNQNNYL